MVGEDGDGENRDEAGEPAGAHERVRQAENAGADDGDEDIGESFRLRREDGGLAVGGQQRRVCSRQRMRRRFAFALVFYPHSTIFWLAIDDGKPKI